MRGMLCVSFTLIISFAASAGGLPTQVQTQKNGKQVITDFVPVKIGPVPIPQDPVVQVPKEPVIQIPKGPVILQKDAKFPDGTATGVVLDATDWYSGCYFTDQYNRRWRLVWGENSYQKSTRLAGWEIDTKARGLLFVTTTGKLYQYIGAATQIPPMIIVPKE